MKPLPPLPRKKPLPVRRFAGRTWAEWRALRGAAFDRALVQAAGYAHWPMVSSANASTRSTWTALDEAACRACAQASAQIYALRTRAELFQDRYATLGE